LGTTGIPWSATKADARYSDHDAPGSSGTVSGAAAGAAAGTAGGPRRGGGGGGRAGGQPVGDAAEQAGVAGLAGHVPADRGDVGQRVAHHHDRLGAAPDQLAGLAEAVDDQRRVGRQGPRQGGDDHQDVQAGVVVHGAERVAEQVPVDQDVAGDVDRVLGGGELGDHGAQALDGRGRELGDLDALVLGPVGDNLAGAARRGDEADPVAWQRAGRGQQPGRDDEVLQAVDPDHAVLAEDRVDDGVVADQGAGVGAGDPGAGLAAADLDRDDRLALGQGLAGQRDELVGAADRLDEQRDNPGGGVLDEGAGDRGPRTHRPP